MNALRWALVNIKRWIEHLEWQSYFVLGIDHWFQNYNKEFKCSARVHANLLRIQVHLWRSQIADQVDPISSTSAKINRKDHKEIGLYQSLLCHWQARIRLLTVRKGNIRWNHWSGEVSELAMPNKTNRVCQHGAHGWSRTKARQNKRLQNGCLRSTQQNGIKPTERTW